MLMHYHPGACIKNKWTCCKQRGQLMLGCQPTYHLLTRSSSRYAQIRRRDTLTNRPPHALTTSNTDPTDNSKPGQGLSNSCMNLALHPPHRIESFLDSPTSRRSSRFSTIDPTLTRVSFASSESGTDAGMSSLKRRSRSQVAPESAVPPADFPPHADQLSSNDTVTTGSNESEQSPVAPPRTKRASSSLTQSHSIHFVPKVNSISESEQSTSLKSNNSLKHSNTFVNQRQNVVKRSGDFGNKIERGLSHSMSALSKPTIDPKVSTTNPNIIHV